MDTKPSYEELENKIEELQEAKVQLKNAKEKLKESEERFKALHDATFGGVIIHNNGIILDCNQGLSDMTGYTNEELVGMNGFNLIKPSSLPTVLENIKRKYDTQYEIEGLRKDGSIYPLAIRGKNITYKNRTLRVIEFRDVTERKKAEDELIRSEERYRELFELSPIGLIVRTIEGRFVSVNPAFACIVGYPVDRIMQMNHWDIIPEKYTKDEHLILNTILEKKSLGPLEKEYLHRDGHLISVRINSMIIKRDENVYIWSSVEDTTALKKAKEEAENLTEKLRQAYKMEAIGTLAGGIAHDFNNILSAIFGYSEMATRYITDDKANECIENILKAATRAKSLVQHILSFSRKESQKRTQVQPHLIIKEALKLIRASIPTTIEIEQIIDPCCGSILADPTQIHQIIMNLCTNSAQAMDQKGGKLTVEVNEVMLSEEFFNNETEKEPGEYIMIKVTDTGSGIKPEHLSRVFDPYFTTKDMGKGTGMGLSVVMGIVKSNEGIIRLSSRYGEGTVFKIYFPKVSNDCEEECFEISETPCGDERILIVDDEKELAKLTKARVENKGYSAVALSSSIEAYETFKNSPDAFDLVITDQTMPDMTGDELCKKIFEIRADIPVIICTGYSSKIDMQKAHEMGISAFIMKPVTENELFATIRGVLDRKN